MAAAVNLFNRKGCKPARKKQSPNSDSAGINDLPPSLILEIFRKLPIKSVICCKCVCKSWKNLIYDPYFAKIYSEKPPFSAVVGSHYRSYSDNDPSFNVLEIGKDGTVTRTPFNPKSIDFAARTESLKIMGSCNGLLLCLITRQGLKHSEYENMNVINPVTGERILLPEIDWVEDINRREYYRIGSSRDNAHYKVLGIAKSDYAHGYKMDVKILTIGVDKKWRDIKDSSSIPRFSNPGLVTLNGVFYWICGDRHSRLVYAFDIEKERGQCITLPPDLIVKPFNTFLGKWNDHLCVIDNNKKYRIDIWTMQKYGAVVSWTREIVMFISSDVLIPITTMSNGELLMSELFGKRLTAYDPKLKYCNELEVSCEGYYSSLYDFVPSFFPIRKVSERNGQCSI